MRTTLTIAALAAGAFAVPYKRDVIITDVDVVYVTDIITVTAGEAPAAYTSAAPSPYESSSALHYGNHDHAQSSPLVSAWATTWTEVKAQPASTSAPAPAYTPAPSSTAEPEPVFSSTFSTITTPAYQVPATSYVPAPSSSSVAPVYSAPSVTSASPSASGDASNAAYTQAVLDSHNLHRSNHSAPDLEWDDGLAQIAMQIAQTCRYAHNTTAGGIGQNIAAGTVSTSIDAVITGEFYNGEEPIFAADNCYGQANPSMDNFENWGHFTQVVWKDTTHVGCYTSTDADCPNGLTDSNGNPLGSDIPPYFTVCNYKNPGNYGGEYANNVGEPLGQPPVYVSA